ncbi:phosphotransferase [Treponema bryantii]|uniref:phosphotransferase n=1 Tax=Treponema bryantii TaxID=163 RepID=UPI0030C7DF34
MLKNDMFDTYQKEALFYQSKMNTSSEYLPEILSVELSDDEIIILMKKYVSLERSNSDGELQKIINTLAKIHNDKIPEFLRKAGKEPLDKERIEYCLNGWKSVLNEHPKVFDEAALNPIAEKINEIISWHNNEDSVLIHGDFHWDNLLKTDDGRICVCDWQNVAIGGASEDLSFFMSRLGADGIQIDLDTILNMYTNAVKETSGKAINPELIKKHIAASNVITTFEFWHEFLHGNPEDRVKGIFDKLIKDFQTVNTSCTSSM